MVLKAKFEEYTESEFISLINRLIEGDYSSEREHDAIVAVRIFCTIRPRESKTAP